MKTYTASVKTPTTTKELELLNDVAMFSLDQGLGEAFIPMLGVSLFLVYYAQRYVMLTVAE